MAFSCTLEMVNIPSGKLGKITLNGELDASTAPTFRNELERAAAEGITRLALLASNLEYMASAGVRTLVFAKQRLGSNVVIYVVSAQECVIETLNMTGISQSLVLLDSYDASQIEG